MFSDPIYLIVFMIVAVGAFTQTVSGFGFALVTVPLLALSVDPRAAVVAASIISLAMTTVTVTVERKYVLWRHVWVLTLAAIVGMPFGLLALKQLPDSALTVIIAVVTLTSTVLVWRGFRLSGSRTSTAIAGTISGVLLTATGTNGPPLVATLQALGLDPRTFRATITAVFTASGVFGVLGFTLSGIVTAQILLIVLVGLVAALAGGWLGNLAFGRINPLRFRQVVLGTLIISSLATLLPAFS